MHRFLAYRDFPMLIKDFENINRVLDLGSGAGDSSQYLFKKGYEVFETDKSSSMIKQSRLNFPYINFVHFDNIKNICSFDLVFSCFVLFELSNKNEIVDYLNLSSDKLRDGGLFFGITGSQDLHQKVRNWACFDVNYPVNENPKSGELVKLGLKDPEMEFYDYFWRELDYRECFQLSNLELFKVYYPLGYRNEKFNLMRSVKVDRSDQVWAADITYIPLQGGFAYLFAIIDWYSRFILEWELSNLLDTDFCIEALERSLKKNCPEIFNTDQGVQFTSLCFTKRLEKEGVKISMDGKGRALDNIFIERLWRSVKYEDIYPKGYESLKELKKGLEVYFEFYNGQRRHQSLGYQTPSEIYYGTGLEV